MSAYGNYKTIMCEQEYLVAGLAELGFKQVEVHAVAQPLVGYHGDERAQVANVIIRRQHIGSASNDVGFLKGEDGNYTAIISQYDSRKFNRQWQGRLAQSYKTSQTMAVAESNGYTLRSRETVQGKVRLTFQAR